jgi:hypothetical protein
MDNRGCPPDSLRGRETNLGWALGDGSGERRRCWRTAVKTGGATRARQRRSDWAHTALLN